MPSSNLPFNKLPAVAEEPAIRIDSLSHYYLRRNDGQPEAVVALKDINLTIGKSEFVAFVGPSGCGKTTLLNILGGLLNVQYGEASIAGKPPLSGRMDIAYMFARDALLPWRTALENVMIGLESRGMEPGEMRARAQHFLERVHVGDFRDAYPSQLSHGMRQRVALARTFALPSDVLLMDEPFAALDAHLRIEAGDLLLELWEQDKRTVVFVTHDLHEAIALADRVVVFAPRPGRIKACIDVSFERPRSVEKLQDDQAYHDLYRRLWREMAA
ncbi:ABC transporter ATP-binding protein [Alcaligenaceae bacterium]|nr:ABC transporter ATP-binding protein [Alcaligenaceae bacterium]